MLLSPEKLVGTVCICNKGRIGLIKKVRKTRRGYVWEGTGLYDTDDCNKINWSSVNPLPIAWSLEDYNQARKMWTRNIEKVR